ncbi:hypothetical protein BDZ91DRAFT_43478 [Kalaharituber pfeilii]|nr:hypothetical protein BDZ91DRAFT_43478 [Kalaharituber pfeilii]
MDQTLQRRINKFGDYFTSVALISLWGTDKTPHVQYQRQVFTMEERNSQKPCDGVPITRSALRAQFPTFNGLPEVEPPYTSISTLEESVHCECSVAMHIRSLLVDKNFTNTPHIKIGVSKQSCLLCHEFLLALNSNDSEHYTRPVYLTSGCDRKVPSTWRAPSGAPQACIRRVEERVQSLMTLID